MRRAVLPALLVVIAAACAGGAEPTTTTDPATGYALEYAASARRAIEGTRFEMLDDREVADLILATCADLAASDDPDETVLDTVAAVEAPEGEEIDDEIFTIVIAEGVAAVCPGEVQAAFLRKEAESDPEGAFLAATAPAARGSGIGRDGLLAAGAEVCSVLSASASPEDAVLAEIALLFGVEGESVADLSASGVIGEDQSLLTGTILGAAAALLCPEHRDTVETYLVVLGS